MVHAWLASGLLAWSTCAFVSPRFQSLEGASVRRLSPRGVDVELTPGCETWDWNGNSIRYARSGGDGQAVVLLHGFGSSLETWRDIVPALAEGGFACYRLDLLGL